MFNTGSEVSHTNMLVWHRSIIPRIAGPNYNNRQMQRLPKWMQRIAPARHRQDIWLTSIGAYGRLLHNLNKGISNRRAGWPACVYHPCLDIIKTVCLQVLLQPGKNIIRVLIGDEVEVDQSTGLSW